MSFVCVHVGHRYSSIIRANRCERSQNEKGIAEACAPHESQNGDPSSDRSPLVSPSAGSKSEKGRTDVLSQQVTRQYQRRCVVSRPGSGWNGVGPTRFTHATDSPLLSADAEAYSDEDIGATAHTAEPASPRPSAWLGCTPRSASTCRPLSPCSPGGLTWLNQ